jgi:hypothetical protein
MTANTRQRLGLLGVLVALLVVVTFVVSRGEGPAGSSVAPSNQPGPTGEPGVPEVADVNLEALKAEHDPPADPERNLFVFRQKAPAPVQPRAAGQRTRTIAPPVASGPPPLPPIPLKYIGLLERGAGGRVAILSDGRGSTFQAREGEVIDGRYTVIRIGPDSIDLSYVDGRGRQSLRLSGQ